MLQQQLQIIDNISLITKHKNALLKIPQNTQQQFFHLYAHRYLLSQKDMHNNLQKVLQILPGSFSNTLINHKFMIYCIQNKIEITSQDYPLIEKLIDWTQKFPSLKGKTPFSLMNIIFQENQPDFFDNIYSLITFIDLVASDIYTLIRKKGKHNQSQPQKIQNYNFSILSAQDLLNFLNISIPKILYNILIENDLLPPGDYKKSQNLNMQCLYKISSLQYYLKTKNNYYSLMRSLIKILLQMQLKPIQQKKLMEIVFNYFYAFHQDKKSVSTDYFIEAYNKLDQSTRFALSDQFLLFFRIAKKIGKSKFTNFLMQKSPWLKQINTKISDNHMIGYPKSSLSPFNPYKVLGESIVVNNGQKIYRYFQILQDYSIFYYKIGVQSQDITFRLYYLGQYNNKSVKISILQNQKHSGQKASNVLAVKRGMYVFQFDNSYSWINKKTIRYELIILNPLQLKASEPNKWIKQFYSNIQGNQAIKEIVLNLPKPAKKKEQIKYQGHCNITKNGPFFNLKMIKGSNVYQYQSQSQQKLIKRFNQLVSRQKKVKWLIDSQPLETDDSVLQKIKGYSESKNIKRKEGSNRKTQKLRQNYNESDKIDVSTAQLNQGGQQI